MGQFEHCQNSSSSTTSAFPTGSDNSLKGRSRLLMEPNVNEVGEAAAGTSPPASFSPGPSDEPDLDLKKMCNSARVHFQEK